MNTIRSMSVQGEQRQRLIREAKFYALYLVFYTALVLSTRPGLEGVQMLDGAKRVATLPFPLALSAPTSPTGVEHAFVSICFWSSDDGDTPNLYLAVRGRC